MYEKDDSFQKKNFSWRYKSFFSFTTKVGTFTAPTYTSSVIIVSKLATVKHVDTHAHTHTHSHIQNTQAHTYKHSQIQNTQAHTYKHSLSFTHTNTHTHTPTRTFT